MRNRTSGRSNPDSKHHDGVTLNDAVYTWAAPQARDHFPPHSLERIAAMKAEGHGMRNLNDEASSWESPGVALTEGSRLTRGGDRAAELLLSGQALAASNQWTAPRASENGETWETKRARNARHLATSTSSSRTKGVGGPTLDMQAQALTGIFHPPSSLDQPIAGGSMSSTDGPNSNQPSAKRKLNPIFVEALMRWPTGLSGFERQETAWTRWWALMPSFVLALCSQKPSRQGSLL